MTGGVERCSAAETGPEHPFSPLLRRMLRCVIVGLVLAAIVGGWWRARPGGAATRVVIAVAARICPSSAPNIQKPSIADGAHALDRAAVHRSLDALGVGRRRCRPARAA